MAAKATSDYAKADQGAGPDRLRATLALDAPVGEVKLVSPARARALDTSMGIRTVRDLLSSYPLRYLDMAQVVSIQQAQIGTQCTLAASVYEVKVKRPRPKLTVIEVSLVDQTGLIIATFFNQPWLAESLAPGTPVSASGTVEFNYGFKRLTNPVIEKIEPGQSVQGKVLTFHPACAKVSRTLMRRFVSNALSQVQGCYDPLPVALRRKYRLPSRYQALRGVHAPESMEDAHQARRRLRYEELFFLELDLAQQQRQRTAEHEPYIHTVTGTAFNALRAALPFQLTADQDAAVLSLLGGMAAASPMNHLLLGDVGTGKTVVSAFGLVAAAASGNQALMMGPTEVLVRQYPMSLGPLLDAADVSWAVLTGSTPAEERARVLVAFEQGAIDVLFGTHALLEDSVAPARCSFVCIDEQQRFGVEQRAKLVAKAPGADVLSMTATPIPRSLALARYGGMTLSYLRQAPAAQGGRTTKVCHFSEEGVAYDALREALAYGQQAYVICPLIGIDLPKGEDETQEGSTGQSEFEYATIEWGLEHDEVGDTLSAATKHAEILKSQVVPEARVELLHGKLSSAEKDRIMEQFRDGVIDVLVSTTVVEVGVDVPNATVMIIEDADRFGLAQLHQLRGRVGRGSLPGKVFLVSRSKAPEALERLAAMEQTEDGFALSEKDLSLRREGDVLGDRQHGRSPLRLVNVVRDANVIEAAYKDAQAFYTEDAYTEEERRALMLELAALRKARQR